VYKSELAADQALVSKHALRREVSIVLRWVI
jgi:hypothetical protein